jgi:hypothetical protein
MQLQIIAFRFVLVIIMGIESLSALVHSLIHVILYVEPFQK